MTHCKHGQASYCLDHPCEALQEPCDAHTAARICAGVEGSLNLHFGIPFGVVCCIASLIGVVCISRLVRRSGKVISPCPSHMQAANEQGCAIGRITSLTANRRAEQKLQQAAPGPPGS